MSNRVRRAAGIGAVSAALVAGAALVLNPPALPPDADEQAPSEAQTGASSVAASSDGLARAEICIRIDLGLGADVRCVAREDLPSLLDRTLNDASGGPAEMTYTSPTDNATAPMVRNCRNYLALRQKGYFAATSMDMRREAFFKRACGAIKALAKASTPSSSNFPNDRLSKEDTETLARSGQFRFGPDDGAPQAAAQSLDIGLDQPGEGIWRYSTVTEEVTLQEIAFADFNNDRIGDVLVFVNAAARGGTASASILGYVEKISPAAPPSFSAITD